MLIWVALPPAVVWLVIVVLFDAFAARAPHREPAWDSTSGKPVPDEFRYLMFPANDAVPLYDKPDGATSEVLTRAVANAPQELADGGWVEVQSHLGSGWARLSDLGFSAPSGRKFEYIKAYETAFRQRNPDASQFRARFSDSAEDAGGRQIRFSCYQDDDHYTECRYTVNNGTTTPLRMDRVFGPALVLGSAMLIPIHAAAALVVVAAGVLVVRGYRRRRSGKVAHPPEAA